MVKHNLIFCFILIICSLTTNCLKKRVDQKTFCPGEEYKYQIKAGQGSALVVSEGFWRNKLFPSLHGLPVNEDDDDEEFEEELEKYEDDNLLLRGGETELYDSKGKKFQLKDLNVWDDDEEINLGLSDFDDVSNLVLDKKSEVYQPVPIKADVGKIDAKLEITDTRGSDFEDDEEESIEKEFLDNDE